MKNARAWIGPAVALVIGLAAGPAGAQQSALVTPSEPPPFHQPPPPPSPYAGPAVVDPAWTASQGGPVGWPGQGGCKDGKCKDFLHRHGMNCWSHHTLPICSSCRSQLDFIFGSCKAYFGEPCLSSRPTVPVPPGYEPFPYGRP